MFFFAVQKEPGESFFDPQFLASRHLIMDFVSFLGFQNMLVSQLHAGTWPEKLWLSSPPYKTQAGGMVVSKKSPTGPHWTDPEKTWVSNSSFATYLGVKVAVNFSIFDGLFTRQLGWSSLCLWVKMNQRWTNKENVWNQDPLRFAQDGWKKQNKMWLLMV